MKKRTSEDDVFIADFAPELKRKYDAAKKAGMTDQEFANSIGVERPSLDRYLNGVAMPSVRTVAFAFHNYHIAIPYGGVALKEALPRKRGQRKPPGSRQLVLPFTIETEKSAAKIDLKLEPISARKFAIKLTLDRTA